MAYDKHFGFDLIQRKTLEKLLAEVGGLTPEQADAVALIEGLPTTDPADGETIWNDNGTLKVAGA